MRCAEEPFCGQCLNTHRCRHQVLEGPPEDDSDGDAGPPDGDEGGGPDAEARSPEGARSEAEAAVADSTGLLDDVKELKHDVKQMSSASGWDTEFAKMKATLTKNIGGFNLTRRRGPA